MEMKQQNSKWEEKPQVKKGNIGEKIITEYLEENNYTVYNPVTPNSHAFDKMAVKAKEEIIIVEVKTKARREKYPDTGFDIRHYEKYKTISKKHNLRVFCFFVDELEEAVYGNFLDVLEKQLKYKYGNGNEQVYPWKMKGIIYFLVKFKIFIKGEEYGMKMVRKLTNEEVAEIKSFATRNPKYNENYNKPKQ